MRSTRNLGFVLIAIGGLLSAFSFASDRLLVFSGLMLTGFILLIVSGIQSRKYAGNDLSRELNRTYKLYSLIGKILRASISNQRDLDAALASRFRLAVQSAPDRRMTFIERAEVYSEISKMSEFFSSEEINRVVKAIEELENSGNLGSEPTEVLKYIKAELNRSDSGTS